MRRAYRHVIANAAFSLSLSLLLNVNPLQKHRTHMNVIGSSGACPSVTELSKLCDEQVLKRRLLGAVCVNGAKTPSDAQRGQPSKLRGKVGCEMRQ